MTSYLVSTCASAMMRLVWWNCYGERLYPVKTLGRMSQHLRACVCVCETPRWPTCDPSAARPAFELSTGGSIGALSPATDPTDRFLTSISSSLWPALNRTETELKTTRNGYHVVIHYFSINFFPFSSGCRRFSNFGHRFPRSRLENHARNLNYRR